MAKPSIALGLNQIKKKKPIVRTDEKEQIPGARPGIQTIHP
jgi:hypothetical protein